MQGAHLKRLREELHCPRQIDLEAALKKAGCPKSQRTISWWETQKELQDGYLLRLKERFLKAFTSPEEQELIQEYFDDKALEEDDGKLTGVLLQDAERKDPPVEPLDISEVDPECLPWCVEARTTSILNRIAAIARASGLTATKLRVPHYGLYLQKAEEMASNSIFDEILFPGASNAELWVPCTFVRK